MRTNIRVVRHPDHLCASFDWASLMGMILLILDGMMLGTPIGLAGSSGLTRLPATVIGEHALPPYSIAVNIGIHIGYDGLTDR